MDGRVLVVDDDALTLETVKGALDSAGFETDVASGGLEAQSLMGCAGYDAAVVDLVMPEVSGLQLLEWMRQNAPRVVPLALSGASSPQKAIDAVQHGAFDFVDWKSHFKDPSTGFSTSEV